MKKLKYMLSTTLSLLLLSGCAGDSAIPAETSAAPETALAAAEETAVTDPAAVQPAADSSVPGAGAEESVTEPAVSSYADPVIAAENLSRSVEYAKTIRGLYWDSEKCLSKLTPSGGKPFLWPYTEQAAMVNGILLAMDKDHEDRAYFEEYLTELIEGFRHYRVKEARMTGNQKWNNENHVMTAFGENAGTPGCYAIYCASRNDVSVDRIRTYTDGVYFDDNVWVAKEMYYAYLNLGDERYLNEAVSILNWIIGEGYESAEGLNGIYWKWSSKFEFAGGDYSDSNHASLNACSSVPTSMMLAKVYRITEGMEKFADLRENYLTCAEAIYRFAEDVLLDRSTGCIVDKIFLKQGFETMTGKARIQKTDGNQYAYNTGTFMTAGAELYAIASEQGRTEDAEFYLSQSAETAAGADIKFGDRTVKAGEYSYPSHSWFTSFLLEGFADLAPVLPEAAEYAGHMRSSLDYAWNNNRAADGLVCPSWIKGWSRFNNNDPDSEDNPRQILLQSANAHCYAMLARHYAE